MYLIQFKINLWKIQILINAILLPDQKISKIVQPNDFNIFIKTLIRIQTFIRIFDLFFN